MPPPAAVSKLRILLNGAPLVGADVWLGEIGGQKKTTDSDGVVSYPAIVSPFQGYTEILVQGADIYASAKLIFVAGQTNTVDLSYPPPN